jgi:CobQ-like glutamine amidotransferase family enzyme
MILKIGYFYPDLLNLYGDNGNVEILVSRAKSRGIKVEVFEIDINTKISSNDLDSLNLVFMGGGPDECQKDMYKDLVNQKKVFFENYCHSNKPGLFICGSYQLMGKYYKSADGSLLEGLNIFDMYTEHFGNTKERCIGNITTVLNPEFAKNLKHNKIGNTLVGFENHGGRTYLGENALSFGTVIHGFGNNGEDKTEGLILNNCLGTYMHGPLLSKNPHIADFLISKAVNVFDLEELDDSLIKAAHDKCIQK